jgi:cobalt/nickel transport system ATP-binding protein
VVKGDNGAGKTTLFRILNGLSFPKEGSYFFDGTRITEKYLDNHANAKLFHKRIGYLFQNPDIMLFNGRTYDEVAFGPRQMGLSDEQVDRRTVDCMKLFSVDDLAEKAPYHLSGGQKKRVALAAVMALNPEVLILDEPFAGLDVKTQEFLSGFLSDLLAAGKTLIIATHDETLTASLADDVIYIQRPEQGHF